jgi:hypothetical protein
MNLDPSILDQFPITDLRAAINRRAQQEKNEEIELFKKEFEEFINGVIPLKERAEYLQIRGKFLLEKYGNNQKQEYELFLKLISESTLLYFIILGLTINHFS